MPGKKRSAKVFPYLEIKEKLLAIPCLEDQFMLAASYANGTRVSEIVGVKRSDITWNELFVYVSTPVRKKRRDDVIRNPPINRRKKDDLGAGYAEPEGWLADIIVNYCTGKEGKLVSYSVRTAQRRFEKYFGCTSHSFRHTRVTHCFQYLNLGERLIQEYFRVAPSTLGDWLVRYGHLDKKDLEARLR